MTFSKENGSLNGNHLYQRKIQLSSALEVKTNLRFLGNSFDFLYPLSYVRRC